MRNLLSVWVASLGVMAFFSLPVAAAERQTIPGHVPAAVAKLKLQPIGRLAATNRIYMVIALPAHNREALTNLLRQMYDPSSTNFHHYLTPRQINEKFGATDAEYQTVLQFARTNGLTIVRTHDDRRMADVGGTVADIENAFHLHLLTYQHPIESRQFYAPDVEPSVEATVPILSISGLNNYSRHIPGAHLTPARSRGTSMNGSGPEGNFLGSDFRDAYAPGVNLTGTGQSVGLVELGVYNTSDITAYEQMAGLSSVTLVNDNQYCGAADDANSVLECSLDIEMAIAMAPGLAAVWVFEGNDDVCTFFDGGDYDDILDSMLGEPQIKIFSSSWSGGGFDNSGELSLQYMALQGQTFFQSSGDGDAYTQTIQGPSDSIFATIVGGTTLTMDASASHYVSETVWNSGFQSSGWGNNGGYTLGDTNGGYWGSGGGVSSVYPIPYYQSFVNMPAVGGSATMRNIPDVALTANFITCVANGVTNSVEGTSCAAPLWAGFAALINEQANNQGLPPIGFLNPALYYIGFSAGYTNAFHDITAGNDNWPDSPTLYAAAPGYDLCTGWGTPNGQGMIDALMAYAGIVWVNFQSTGSGNGSYYNPFSTLDAGVAAVATKGTIGIFGPNSTNEATTIYKSMTIRSFYGPVIIGK